MWVIRYVNSNQLSYFGTILKLKWSIYLDDSLIQVVVFKAIILTLFVSYDESNSTEILKSLLCLLRSVFDTQQYTKKPEINNNFDTLSKSTLPWPAAPHCLLPDHRNFKKNLPRRQYIFLWYNILNLTNLLHTDWTSYPL